MSQQPWGAPPPPRIGSTVRGPQWSAPQQWPAPQPWSTGGGQQWPAPRQWPAPPPPRKPGSGLANAVRIVLAVVSIIMVASALKGFLAGASPSPADTGTGAEQRAPGPQVPGDPTTSYVNEDYDPPPVDRNPPPVPGPRSMDAAGRLVTENPLYDQLIPVPTNCTMDRVSLEGASPSQKQAHFNELMGCLMTVFAEPVEAAGFTLPRPPVTVYARPIKTACGDFSDVNAAYCTGDQRIYYANNLMDAFPPSVSDAGYAPEMVLAHEFGHAIQARTAILISEKYLEQDARSEAAALDLSRRTEVQADCLAGQYVRSVAQSQGLGAGDVERLDALVYNLGDDVLSGEPGYSGGHGTGEARRLWFDRGTRSDAVGTCNSFTVSSDEVR